METFNRVVTVLCLFVALLVCLALAVFPLEVVGAVTNGARAIQAFLQLLENASFWPFVVARVLLMLVAIAVFALLLWNELRPHRPPAVPVHTEAGSTAEVTADSVERRLAWHIGQVPDVLSVVPQVRRRDQMVDVHIDLRTNQEIEVPSVTDKIVALARQTMTEQMGLQVEKIEVHIEHAPYDNEA